MQQLTQRLILITVTTADMRIEIAKEPCRMTVQKADGTMLFWEPSSGGVFDDGVRFVRASSSNLYGIHSYDCFSSNGELLRNDNTDTATAGQQGNSGGPFMWSTAGYMVCSLIQMAVIHILTRPIIRWNSIMVKRLQKGAA